MVLLKGCFVKNPEYAGEEDEYDFISVMNAIIVFVF